MSDKESKDLISQLKSLLPILVVVGSLAGFYYTTQHRLDSLEAEIVDLNAQWEIADATLEERLSALEAQVVTAQSDVDKMEKRYRRRNGND